MSAFDRSARLKTDQPVSQEKYLEFVSRAVLALSNDEQALVASAWNALLPRLSQLSLPFPDTIYFVKTTGKEEGGQEYTRGAAIILPQSALDKKNVAELKATIAHELFHVLSRNSPQLRQRVYAAIGFLPCKEIPFPSELAVRKVTDPDAPKNDHYLKLRVSNKEAWAVPILYSNALQYNTAKGGEFFQYIEFRFLMVREDGTYDSLHPTLLTADQVSDFYEQVGKNTQYIVHPEEILADNFRFLLLGTTNLPSPGIVGELASALKGGPR